MSVLRIEAGQSVQAISDCACPPVQRPQIVDDCACPKPVTGTLTAEKNVQTVGDCACPPVTAVNDCLAPTAATLERGEGAGVFQQECDCACPDVAPIVVTGEAPFPVEAGAATINVHVVVPQV